MDRKPVISGESADGHCTTQCALKLHAPGRDVDLDDPGFEVFVQHHVEAEQLVDAVPPPHVDLHQTVNA